jgi:hypothetical protein
MNLIERPPLDKLQLLDRMTFKYYCDLLTDDKKKKIEKRKDLKTHFNEIKKFIKNSIKTKGNTKCLFTMSKSTKVDEGGRLFCHDSIQAFDSKIRGYLYDGITTDVDFKNCHPSILEFICKKHDISCLQLSLYNKNVDEYRKTIPDCKTKILMALNTSTKNRYKNETLSAIAKELRNIQKELAKIEEYGCYLETATKTNPDNILGSFTNRVMCLYENKMLQVMFDVITTKHNLEVCTLMFDGLMFYGEGNQTIINDIQDAIRDKFNINMIVTYKPHETTITSESLMELKEVDDELLFHNMKEEFEKTHCKIINKSIFIKKIDNNNVVMAKPNVKTSYEHMICYSDSDGEPKAESFINKWFVCPSMRCYEDTGVYPNGIVCPDNHYNLWDDFVMENVDEYEEKNIEMILNHIKILCGNNDIVYDYIIKWIAQMIQYPAVKTVCPTLISDPGAGKNTLLLLFRKMMGTNKVLESTTPSRDVWGDFNGMMSNSFLINLNELSKNEQKLCEGKIKGLITDDTLIINNKGIGQYPIKSYHRFIGTTNSKEPLNVEKGDRRNMVIRSSDEKIGDKEYFNTLYEQLNDTNYVKTCYEYFKSIPNMDKFNSIPIPQTDYQNNLKELSLSPIEQWLKDYVMENYNKKEFNISSNELFTHFNEWKKQNHINYEINSLKFGVRLSNMNITGLSKGNPTKTGKTKIFNIPLIAKHYELGCLIDVDDMEM